MLALWNTYDPHCFLSFAEGLKNFPRHASAANLQMQKAQEAEKLGGIQGATDRSTLNKLMELQPGLNSQMSNNKQMVGCGALSGSAQAGLAPPNYQNLLMRQNSMNSNTSVVKQEASSSLNNSNQNQQPSPFQGPTGVLQGNSMQNLPVSGYLTANVPQQQQRLLNSNVSLPQNHQQPANQVVQQQILQQLLQDINTSNNGSVVQQQSLSGHATGGGGVSREGVGFGNNASAATATAPNGPGNVVGPTPTRNNSFKAASNSESSIGGANNGFPQKAPDLPHNLHISEEMLPDISQDFTDSGFFNSDLDNNMNYGWKA